MRVDIALQGPKSRDILLALGCKAKTAENYGLKRTELCEAAVGGLTWSFHAPDIPAKEWPLNYSSTRKGSRSVGNLLEAGTHWA